MKTIHQLDAKDLVGIVAEHFRVSEADVFLKAGRTTVGTGESRRTEYAINCTVTIDDRQPDARNQQPTEAAQEIAPDPTPDQWGGGAAPEPDPPEAPATTERMIGAKGLLRLYCRDCGNTFGAFAREYQTEIACKCGKPIDLTGPLARFRFTCPYCYHEGWGKTNGEDAEITVRCRCGEDLTLRWDPTAKEYKN